MRIRAWGQSACGRLGVGTAGLGRGIGGFLGEGCWTWAPKGERSLAGEPGGWVGTAGCTRPRGPGPETL